MIIDRDPGDEDERDMWKEAAEAYEKANPWNVADVFETKALEWGVRGGTVSNPLDIEAIDGLVTVEKGSALIDLVIVDSGNDFESAGVTLTREQALQVAKALEAAAKEA